MFRIVDRRVVQASGSSIHATHHQIDLRLVAMAAAVETLQVDLVVSGWVGLFQALLVPGSELRWLQNGPGGEAEIKRAYSALFGRFFGRAVLRHEHGCVDLRQVREGMEVAPGYVLQRKRGVSALGDLPDWVGWTNNATVLTICEAKGSRDSGDWENRIAPPLREARKQVERVEIRDFLGMRIQTKDWVVGSRWGTEANGKAPTITTIDPLTDGRPLEPAEADQVAASIYAHWVAELLSALGREDLAIQLHQPGDEATASLERGLIEIDGRPAAAALVIDGAGFFPLGDGSGGRERLNTLQSIARDRGRKSAVVGVDLDAIRLARRRGRPDQAMRRPVLPDGPPTVSVDGVTLTWDPDRLSILD